MKLAVALLLLELLALANIKIGYCNGSAYIGCIQSEREALLRFKQDLKDPANRLALWSDGNCCTWAGVVCNDSTGHVLELRLGNPFLHDDEPFWLEDYKDETSKLIGKINPSLLDLKHLVYLELSNNNFEKAQLPVFLGSMGSLRHIDLSRAEFTGMIPYQLGNLSNLQYLDLSSQIPLSFLYLENFSWLSGLSLLKHLDLTGVDLSTASDWFLVTNMLPSLQVLKLSACSLHNSLPELPIANFSSLYTLDLSYNEFDNTLVPSWVFGLSHLCCKVNIILIFLKRGFNSFGGPIPDGLQNLTSLEHLDLRSNNFISSIPTWLHKFTRLEYLSLRGNRLEGQISSVVGNLSSTIKSLNLDYSEVQGKIPTSIARLCNLRSISIIDVKLSQDISQIIDIFSGCVSDVIEIVDLRDNKLSSQLINELGQFKSLQGLLLGDNMISGHIPSSLGKLSSLQAVSLSNNKLNGTLSEIHFANLTSLLAFYVSGNSLTLKVSPDWVPPFKKIKSLDLGSCNSGPQFPSWINSLEHLLFLDMPNSGILGTIPSRFFKSIPRRLKHFNLSHNHIYGEISSLSEATQLESVDLNSNSLSGPIPFIPFNIRLRDLSNNALAGSLFHFLCSERNEAKHSMEFLILTNNSLSGELPDCWMNLQHLSVLKLGNNAFTGALPASMGSLTSLHSLQLDHNNLSGPIPASLQNCAKLVVFDIGENGFS
ncbi:receptor-like protein EIX1 [Citrus clementina]|uniref:receptor-like protein EIX1 n=1 Tax=Citrus clementina TaxID=85681 RepID=UPI000CED0B14|nr:receptor-like protein EIX1 [Citrus x clementina]